MADPNDTLPGATFPLPPPAIRFPIIDVRTGQFNQIGIELFTMMWAAIDGDGGAIPQIKVLTEDIAILFGMHGDATISSDGEITVTKTQGVPFGPFATGTDAGNLTGVAPRSVIPIATTSGLGGVIPDGTTITVDPDGTIHSTAGAITPANPTAVAGNVAVNGVATTYMRSDAAPAVQLGLSSQFGIVKVDGTTITSTAGVISSVGGATGANPTATASNVAVNGAASTFMRSDAAPAVQLATTGQFGLVKPDGTTVTISAGVISSVGGSSPIANDTFLANISGGSAVPSATTNTAWLDAVVGNTRGDLLYRGASAWAALAPGATANLPLVTGGAGADPAWATNVNVPGWLNVGATGAPANTGTGDLTAAGLFFAGDTTTPTFDSATNLEMKVGYSTVAFPAGTIAAFGYAATGAPDAGGTTTLRMLSFRGEMTGSANSAGLQAFFGRAVNSNSGTMDGLVGAFAVAQHNSAGITTSAYGHRGIIQCTAAGSITTGYTLYAQGPTISGGGTIGSLTGLYVQAQKVAGVTTGYGVRQVGTSDLNQIAGRTTIGAAADPTTSAVLDINSTTGAVMVPRMTTTQRLALTPSNSMMVYDTTLGQFYAYGAGAWGPMVGGAAPLGNIWSLPVTVPATTYTGAHATVGNGFVPAVNMTVDRIILVIDNPTIGNIISAFIATIASNFNITGTVATANARFTTTATGKQTLVFTIPLTTLVAGTKYLFALVVTNKTTTTAPQGIYAPTAGGYPGIPPDVAGLMALGGPAVGAWYDQNSDAPTSATNSSTNASISFTIGVRAQV